RSCGVTAVRVRPFTAGQPFLCDIEITYRPNGTVFYVGGTKYDSWTMLVLDQKQDGTLLDGHGQPLPPSQPPVYLPYEVYHDVEFNEINFGEFVSETELQDIPHVAYEDLFKQAIQTGRFSSTAETRFMA